MIPTRVAPQGSAKPRAASSSDQLGFDPQSFMCPHCHVNIVTNVENQLGFTGFIFCFFLFLFFGWISCCLFPFIVPLLKSAVHRCPRCVNELGSKSRIGIPDFRDEVLTFSCGKCAVVLSRKYVLSALSVVGILSLLFFLLVARGHDHHPVHFTSSSWPEYLADCGSTAHARNPVRASMKFRDLYLDRTVSWAGMVLKIDQGRGMFHSGDFTLWLEMNPSDLPVADILLAVPTHLQSQVSQLNPGDFIRFNGTVIGLGGQNHQPHHFHAVGVSKMEAEEAKLMSRDPRKDFEDVRERMIGNALRFGMQVINMRLRGADESHVHIVRPVQLPDGTVQGGIGEISGNENGAEDDEDRDEDRDEQEPRDEEVLDDGHRTKVRLGHTVVEVANSQADEEQTRVEEQARVEQSRGEEAQAHVLRSQ